MNPHPSSTPNRQQGPAPSSYTTMFTRPIDIGAIPARNDPRHDLANYPTPTGPSHGSASAPHHPSNLFTTTPPNPSVSTPVYHSGRSFHSGTNSFSIPRIPPPPMTLQPPNPVLPNALNFGTVDADADNEEELPADDDSSDDDAPVKPYHTLKSLYQNNRKEMKYIFFSVLWVGRCSFHR